MKKLMAVVFVLVLLAGAWYVWRARWGRKPLPAPRAMMRDENVPRPVEPSVAFEINEGDEAAVLAGNPLWFTVGVSNAAAVNERAAGRTPRPITLGEAARPWTAAVEFRGVAAPPLLGAAPGAPIELGTMRSAEASFGWKAAALAAGTYSVAACLGPTGSWKGRVCSAPVRLIVQARPPALAAGQELEIARQTGRFGLRAGDAEALDSAGRRLVAANPGSIDGRLYLGEARYQQGKWEQALAQFAAARAEFARQHPNGPEGPRFLSARIGQLMEKLGAAR